MTIRNHLTLEIAAFLGGSFVILGVCLFCYYSLEACTVSGVAVSCLNCYFLVSEYTYYMKSVSYGKQSLVMITIQPTYTDVITSWDIVTTIDTPTILTLNLHTKSGIGKKHIAVLRAKNFPEMKIITKFRLTQAFIFSKLRQGELYTIYVKAYSKGQLPWIREYTYVDFTYPAVVQQSDGELPLDVKPSTLTWKFYSLGVKHNWVIS